MVNNKVELYQTAFLLKGIDYILKRTLIMAYKTEVPLTGSQRDGLSININCVYLHKTNMLVYFHQNSRETHDRCQNIDRLFWKVFLKCNNKFVVYCRILRRTWIEQIFAFDFMPKQPQRSIIVHDVLFIMLYCRRFFIYVFVKKRFYKEQYFKHSQRNIIDNIF